MSSSQVNQWISLNKCLEHIRIHQLGMSLRCIINQWMHPFMRDYTRIMRWKNNKRRKFIIQILRRSRSCSSAHFSHIYPRIVLIIILVSENQNNLCRIKSNLTQKEKKDWRRKNKNLLKEKKKWKGRLRLGLKKVDHLWAEFL